MDTLTTDTLIIGTGIAGATAALTLSDDPRRRVLLLTRAPQSDDSNSAWAQGGIVTRGLDDSPELLVEDILRAGAGLSDRRAAQLLAAEGPRLVQSILMERCGVKFDRELDGELSYGLEGAHSTRRVVHVGDQTGAAIIRGLLSTLAERPNVILLTDHTALDLIVNDGRCVGAWVWNSAENAVTPIYAANTILATGGLGQLYPYTTNPGGARGDGIGMAARAGLRIENAEYIQFHPTAFYAPGQQNHLISEAVRGEGAHLLTPDGERFMRHYAPDWLELAPRDVVARAIHAEMQAHDYDYVLLDIANHRPADFIRRRFPQLVENATLLGYDPTHEPLPIVPAAHYFCGGVPVDLNGRTALPGLYAVGEVSCTGLHGANRLASTSLLEGLVWGHRAAQDVAAQPLRVVPKKSNQFVRRNTSARTANEEMLTTILAHMKRLMWAHVGLVRDAQGLRYTQRELARLAEQVEAIYQQSALSDALIGARNMLHAAQIVTVSAMANDTSRGGHFRVDSPQALTLTGD